MNFDWQEELNSEDSQRRFLARAMEWAIEHDYKVRPLTFNYMVFQTNYQTCLTQITPIRLQWLSYTDYDTILSVDDIPNWVKENWNHN